MSKKMPLNEDEANARSALLLRDAEEDLARERMHAFWRQWGSTIIGMCLMLVVGTAAGVGFRQWREAQNAQSTNQLANLIATPGIPVTDETAKDLTDTHAAIAWLARAGTIQIAGTPTAEQTKELQTAYEAAAQKGDDTPWGLLARWNVLRLRMDDASADPKDLIKDLDSLADQMDSSALRALPLTDAAVIAGERLKDPEAALDFLDRAEKAAGNATQMTVYIADLRHLYEIRAADADATTEKK